MKLQPECIPCFMSQTLRALSLWKLGREEKLKALREVMSVLSMEDYEKTPFQIACKVFKRLREVSSIDDPYEKVKIAQNTRAMDLYPKIKEKVFGSEDPFKEALKYSVAGNLIDFGSPEGYKTTPEAVRELAERIDFKVDFSEELKKDLQEAKKVMFFADNCGEIVFDLILLEAIKEIFEVEKIKVYVRGGPILNDVTIKEAKALRMDKIPWMSLGKVSNGDQGSGPEINSKEIINEMRRYDVVISKGQANYEALGEISGIYLLLVAKCDPVARELSVDVGDPLILRRRFSCAF